jgi:hypothetical protein
VPKTPVVMLQGRRTIAGNNSPSSIRPIMRRLPVYTENLNSGVVCLPEVSPASRNRSKQEVIVCSMDPAFLHGVEEEMEKHPEGTIHRPNGQYDAALRQP